MSDPIDRTGIDRDEIRSMLSALEERPEAGRFRFRARSQWMGGARCRTTIKEFEGGGRRHTRRGAFVLETDEPPVLLGEDHAPTATEAVLHALGACLAGTVVFHAALRDIELRRLEVELEGELDLRGFLGLPGAERRGYHDLEVKVHVDADEPPDLLEEIGRHALEHSPVLDIVANPVGVKTTIVCATSGEDGDPASGEDGGVSEGI